MTRTQKSAQKGATLLVSMIMLLVLTLLVVYAIRSGNTNLRVVGNMQVQAEANAVAQQNIEAVIEQIKAMDSVTAGTLVQTTNAVNNASYAVKVNPLSLVVEVPVLNSALNPANANDVPCFESPDTDKAITSTGALTTTLSGCKTQQWEVSVEVADTASGVATNQVQGISIRVPAAL